MLMGDKIGVLVVDDSAIVRQTLTDILQSDPSIEVIATAPDPFIAAQKIAKRVPDVITLDVEMPRMDGITFLQKIMNQHPIPVIMCSSLTDRGCETGLKALECGAVDIITKPKLGVKGFLEESKVLICDSVKAAARTRIRRIVPVKNHVEKKLTADVMIEKPTSRAMIQTTEKIVIVGASTGTACAPYCQILVAAFQ